MDWAKNISIIISIISLGTSILSIYLSQFRKPRIVVRVGPDIHLYHPSDVGTALYVPMIFTNESPTRGAILQVFIELLSPDGKCYMLKWQEEAEIELRTWNYKQISRVKPFTVDGYSTVDKVFWFSHPSEQDMLFFVEGAYSLRAYIWTKDVKKPTIKTFDNFTISKQVETILQKRFEEKDPQSRFLYLDKKTFVSKILKDDRREFWKDDSLIP